jgi:hypothetical protein
MLVRFVRALDKGMPAIEVAGVARWSWSSISITAVGGLTVGLERKTPAVRQLTRCPYHY